MARVLKHLVVLAFVAYIVIMCAPGVDAKECTKCRYIAGDFPFGAKCTDDANGEKGYCCTSTEASPTDCDNRDMTKGGFSCKDTFGMQRPYAHCCFECDD